MESELGMEIWKKCSAVILAFCLMISGLQAFAHTENYTETDSGTKAVDYLMMLRIADERAVFTGETPLTKGEAAALIVKALGETDTARMMEVPAGLAGRSHADMAAYAVSRGILAGDGLAQSWDETITAIQAAKMMVAALATAPWRNTTAVIRRDTCTTPSNFGFRATSICHKMRQ